MIGLRDAWWLWRLVRRMQREGSPVNGATITMIVHPHPSWTEQARAALENGDVSPFEVAYYPDMSRPAMARKGWTLREAIRRALEKPTRED